MVYENKRHGIVRASCNVGVENSAGAPYEALEVVAGTVNSLGII